MTKHEEFALILRQIEGLKESPLYSYRKDNGYFPVVGEGDILSNIMLVGEAPGKNEAKTGKPFCGSAGKVLDKIMDHIGIDRKDMYITNIVKDRPPENRDPSKKEIEIYSPFLDRQIEAMKPRAIGTLGRYSMEYILRRFCPEMFETTKKITIGEAHGKTFKANAGYGEIDIIVLYHPCVAVYNPHNLDTLKEDYSILKKYI